MKVIAAVGKNGSGKDFFLEHLAREHGLPLISIGDIVRELAVGDGLALTRENLHKTSRKYMDWFGRTFFPERIVAQLKDSDAPIYLVGGIRPLSDIVFLKEAFSGDFCLVNIAVTDDTTRYERMLLRNSARDKASVEELMLYDAEEERLFRTHESERMADVVIKNDGTVKEFQAEIEEFYTKYMANYGKK